MAVRLSKQAWRAIKSEYVQGRSAKELAQRFGITAWAIHKRSSAERWRDEIPVPPSPVPARPGGAAKHKTSQGGEA